MVVFATSVVIAKLINLFHQVHAYAYGFLECSLCDSTLLFFEDAFFATRGVLMRRREHDACGATRDEARREAGIERGVVQGVKELRVLDMGLVVHVVRLGVRLLALGGEHRAHHCGGLCCEHLLLLIRCKSKRLLIL
jgi:hypothetical protein